MGPSSDRSLRHDELTGSGADGGSRPVRTAVWTAQLAILTGCVTFWASVALLTHYVNDTGGETLLTATNSDPASPLHPRDF